MKYLFTITILAFFFSFKVSANTNVVNDRLPNRIYNVKVNNAGVPVFWNFNFVEDSIVGAVIASPPPAITMPQSFSMFASSQDAVMLDNVPAFNWSFGCSATAASMLAGYYDRISHPNMYNGPTNNGVMPLDNSSWGTTSINGETRALCPLSATRQGLDGLLTYGHVDDYWVSELSESEDPYITGSWAQHVYADCTGDYMKTNQSAFGNIDGSTTFYYYTERTPFRNFTVGEDGERNLITNNDGCYGIQLFFESRGYTVNDCYTQLIYNESEGGGFSFDQYMTEIDAGRPVMIQVQGHSMLGVGYLESNQTVYLHDTWDYNVHEMIWGGEYSGMAQWGVSVLQLESNPAPLQLSSNINSSTISLSWGSPASDVDFYEISRDGSVIDTTALLTYDDAPGFGRFQYNVVAFYDDGRYSPPSSVEVTISEIVTWTGLVDSDWSNAGNWDLQVPRNTDVVIIPASANHPVISTNTEVHNLTINEGAEIEISSGKSLNVYSRLVNNAGTNGILLRSDVNGTATLLTTSENIQATVQQFYQGGAIGGETDYWHYFATPISGNQSVETYFSNQYVIEHDESEIDENSWNYLASGDTLVVGCGYGVWSRSEQNTVSFIGELNTGEINLNTRFTDENLGWNFIGNPYSCAINWEALTIHNVDDAIYLYDSENGTYKAYVNGVSNNGQSKYIAPMQGFFVRANAVDGSVQFSDQAKVSEIVEFKNKPVGALLKLAVSHDGIHWDELIIQELPYATQNFDNYCDAHKLLAYSSSTPQIYAIENEVEYSIYAVPEINGNTSIHFNVFSKGSQEIQIKVIENNLSGSNAELCDQDQNHLISFSEMPYFYQTDGAETDEFIINFNEEVTEKHLVFDYDVGVTVVNQRIQVYNLPVGENLIEIYKINGAKILETSPVVEDADLGEFEDGIYLVKIKNWQQKAYSKKVWVH